MSRIKAIWAFDAVVVAAAAYVLHHAADGPELPLAVHWGVFILVAVACLVGARALRRPLARAVAEPEIKARLAIIRRLAAVIDGADPFTRGRSYRISKWCLRVGQELGMRDEDLEELELAALLHDIGRTAIHHDVLLKRGDLSHEDREEIRSHPRVSYEIVKDLVGFGAVAEMIYAHHEQPDGQGYPRGIGRAKIPMGARIIMVVAAFDAMITDRPYRLGLSMADAYKELQDHAGTMFFPTIVDVFVRLHKSGAIHEHVDEEELAAFVGRSPEDRSASQLLAEAEQVA